MGGFKRVLLGYRRADVDAALAERGTRIAELEREMPRIGALERAVAERDAEMMALSSMVVERERDNRELREELRTAQERHDRSLASLESLSERLEEVQAQARGQATRIRMKALQEAVEVSRRVQELSEQREGAGAANGSTAAAGPAVMSIVGDEAEADSGEAEVFAGSVRIDVGPLRDFSQLVGIEDAAAQIRELSGISVERFSGGRATLALQLDDPVELLRELEERCPLSFEVRQMGAEHLVLDVADGAAEHRAA